MTNSTPRNYSESLDHLTLSERSAIWTALDALLDSLELLAGGHLRAAQVHAALVVSELEAV